MQTGSDSLPVREDLILIKAPHFIAGIVLINGQATVCAPIVEWLTGWTIDGIIDVCNKKKWHWEYVIPVRSL